MLTALRHAFETILPDRSCADGTSPVAPANGDSTQGELIRNGRFEALAETVDRERFCDGWSIAFGGSPVANRFIARAEGSGAERRLALDIRSVERWFRLRQQIELPSEGGFLRCAISAARASGTVAPATLRRVCLMAIDARGWYSVHRRIALAVELPDSLETLEWRVPFEPTGPDVACALVLEFDEAVQVQLREVSLRVEKAADGAGVETPRSPADTSAAAGTIVPMPASAASGKSAEEHYRVRLDRCEQRRVSGWAASLKDPGAHFDVRLYVDDLFYAAVRNDRRRDDLKQKGMTGGHGGFLFELPPGLARGQSLRLRVELPDGTASEDTVVPCTPQIVATRRWSAPAPARDPQALAIIVPVYDAFEDLCVCIERLERHTTLPATLILIDDASPDPRVAPRLERAGCLSGVRVLRNEVNLGFTRTINRGIEQAGTADVVLLNSDARVTPGWLEGLVEAARSRPRVATVTPLSDNAGAFSAPVAGCLNPLPSGIDEADFARLVRRQSDRLRPSLPTGNGFCMYVSRAAIDELGALDGEAFPRGYGEENDFCMRAFRAGWSHLLDDATYVFHERSASFKAAKTELIAAGRAVVDERYPEYKPLLAAFASPAMSLARYRVRQASALAESGAAVLPRVLFVYSTQTGGTPQTNRDLMGSLAGVLEGWTLRCDADTLFLCRLDGEEMLEMRTHELAERIEPLGHVSDEYDEVVARWLGEFDFSLVHVRHLGWHSLNLPKVARAAGIPVVLSFHDFYALCPTVKLLDESDRYCGGTCTATDGQCRPDLWPGRVFPLLKNAWVGRWRGMFAEILPFCDAFVTTSPSARTTILGAFPEISDRFEVIPHGRDFDFAPAVAVPPEPDSPIRILLPGTMTVAKGLDVVGALLEHDVAGQLEFHFLGRTPRGLEPSERVILHGEYRREEFADRARAIAPNVGAVLSIWDETWCHTLTELWSVGLPVIVFDYGTVGGRVHDSGAGWVFEHDDIPALYRQLTGELRDPDGFSRRIEAVSAWQAGEGRANGTAAMGSRYLSLYRRVARSGFGWSSHVDSAPGGPASRSSHP